MSPLRPAVFALLLMPFLVAPALAHAALDHATPGAGSTVHKSPPQLKLWFTEEIEPAFSSVAVFDASGHEVDKRDAAASADDKKMLVVSVPPLLPGRYKVVWRVVAADTHKTEGSYAFVVAP